MFIYTTVDVEILYPMAFNDRYIDQLVGNGP